MSEGSARLLGAGMLFAVGIPICFARLHAGRNPAVFYNDDFFYYLQIAKNLAVHGRSSFDGTHLTNGYHPLWMAIIVTLFKLLPGRSFYLGLQSVVFALSFVTYFAGRRVLALYTGNEWLASLGALTIAVLSLRFGAGMEASLAVPATMLLISYRISPGFAWDRRGAMIYGLLSSFAVLSRVDSMLLIFVLLLIDFGFFRKAQVTRALAWFIVGGLPLAAYFVSNLMIFGTLIPVSGMAKSLRLHRWPSLTFVSHILVSPIDRLVLVDAGLLALVVVTGALLIRPMWLRRRGFAGEMPDETMLVLSSICIFPVLYGLVEMVLSDWPMFLWYLYPTPLLFLAACIVLLCSLEHRPKMLPRACYGGMVVCGMVSAALIFLSVRAGRAETPMLGLVGLDERIVKFQGAHPGIYADGDRAGYLGYISSEPLVQMEGLVMEKAFLQQIDRQADLHVVLRSYGARYYVAQPYALEQPSPGCYALAEPVTPWGDAKRMRGIFCNPVMTYSMNNRTTLIFDLEGSDPGRGPAM